MKSPFEDLQIDPALVSEFFAVFSRFEYAMKATRYCSCDRYQNAKPNWRSLQAAVGQQVSVDDAVVNAVDYLLREPPQVQKVIDGRPQFRHEPIVAENPGAMAIEAAKRVRNNLFHGGKETPHSPPERDTRLIEAALVVLQSCLAADPQLNSEFEHQLV